MKSVKPVTRNCSASGSLSDTMTSFDPTVARLAAYRRRTSMKVEPTSLRSRRRRITTVFRDDGVTSGSAASKIGAAAKNRLP